MPDYGIPAGLAYRHNWDAVSAHDMQLNMLQKQAEIDRMNKAKLFADGIKFGRANNRWDHDLYKNFAEAKVKEIGKYATENPDYLQNPAKLLYMNQMKDSLMNNPILESAMRVDTHYKNMMEYGAKNPNMANDPKYLEALQAYDNYSKTGSADGIPQNHKEFIFMAPEEQVDTDKFLRETAHLAEHDGLQTFNNNGFRQYHTKSNKINVALGALNDAKMGRYVQKKWQDLSDDQKANYQNKPENYIADVMDPYFKKDSYSPGTVFNPYSSKNGKTSKDDGLTTSKFHRDIVNNLYTVMPNGKAIYSGTVQGNARGIYNIQHNTDGSIDLSDAEIKVGKDYKKVNLGTIDGKSTGKVVGRGNYMSTEHTVNLTPAQYKKYFNNYGIDKAFLPWNDDEVENEGKNFVKIIADKDNNPVYQVTLYKPLSGNEASIGVYGAASHEGTRDAQEQGGYELREVDGKVYMFDPISKENLGLAQQ